jgi:hypothetical protein
MSDKINTSSEKQTQGTNLESVPVTKYSSITKLLEQFDDIFNYHKLDVRLLRSEIKNQLKLV